MRRRLTIAAVALVILVGNDRARGADFNFFGRSGDAIEINLGAIPGIAAGSSFASLNTAGFANHTVLTSDLLTAQPFSTTGRLWFFANPARDTTGEGDTNTAARGFQGTLGGSVLVNGVSKTFSVTVAPGYTGSGAGAVNQGSESMGDATNNPLFVAQQQQRLRYLGFVAQGGAAIAVDGDFGPNTDGSLRTFQGAFVGGVNTTQADVDGIIGPNTAGWLNAQNAPTWSELIDPDPQPPGTFTIGGMIGNFDIYPGGDRSGTTPQPERFATNWTIDLIKKGSALAKAATGRTQRINALSRSDGYASSCCHNTHRVGMDIDLGTESSTWNPGNGTLSSEEQKVASHAISFASALSSGRVARVITSNDDIYAAIDAATSVELWDDPSGAHENHLHIDVDPPARVTGLANLTGDFNLDDVVDAKDYVVWRANLNKTLVQSNYTQWRANFGKSITNRPIAAGAEFEGSAIAVAIPEPSTWILALLACCNLRRLRRDRTTY